MFIYLVCVISSDIYYLKGQQRKLWKFGLNKTVSKKIVLGQSGNQEKVTMILTKVLKKRTWATSNLRLSWVKRSKRLGMNSERLRMLHGWTGRANQSKMARNWLQYFLEQSAMLRTYKTKKWIFSVSAGHSFGHFHSTRNIVPRRVQKATVLVIPTGLSSLGVPGVPWHTKD